MTRMAGDPRRTFQIVSSYGPYDVLGMRQRGQTMGSVSAPGQPGWLGNPFVADDAGGSMSRAEATARFGELVRKKAENDSWKSAFLDLEGKRVGYYKPNAEHIHLHELQNWLAQQVAQSAQAPSVWAFGGARTTPPDVQELISRIAQKHVLSGGAVVHGGAPGADRAAGRLINDPSRLSVYLRGGADPRGPDPMSAGGRVFNAMELPAWQQARALAAQYEDPYRPGGRDYNARNMVVLMGPQLNTPRDRLVVWTPGGQAVGGTGHAIRAAQGLGIDVRNLGNPETLARAQRWLQG
jgi:hypothetical protein